MRPTSTHREQSEVRLPKSFRLLHAAIALADECAAEMVACLDAPDLAATGDRIEHIEDQRRALAATLEDHLRGALLSAYDPADLHSLSADIAMLTHRAARALYFFTLLGSAPPPSDLRLLARVLRRATSELVALVGDLAGMRPREVGQHVHEVRRLRAEGRLHTGRLANMDPSDRDRDVVLWRTVGEAIDAATGQAHAVAEVALRVVTKHD